MITLAVIAAVLGGFFLVGLYGDVVIGEAIVGIVRLVETTARLASQVLQRLRTPRLAERRAARFEARPQ